MEQVITCINCPMGCRLTVAVDGETVARVEGNVCKRGVEYARQEALTPVRTVTALMRAGNRAKPFSVKTAAPIPKRLIFACVNAIYDAKPLAPLSCGDVIIPDVCETGVPVVATQDCP